MTTIEIPLLLRALDSVSGWFGLLRKEQKERKEGERKAIQAISIALTETLAYFRELKDDHVISESDSTSRLRYRKTESDLAKRWMDAAVDLREVNSTLSERCFMKGVYWSDRSLWNDDRIKSAHIELEALINDAKGLLR